MTDFKKKCIEYFGTSDFYEILKVDKNASPKEIKKAYHRLSLLVHPDRVEESKKVEATEKFKVLGRINFILQDPDKRKIYDDSGDFDEENDTAFDWMQYWRSMFKKITTEDITRYKQEYIGSETELRDIKKAYVNGKGDMDYILEMVAFSSCEDEPRIIDIVKKLVVEGEVEEYEKFFKEPKKKKEKRRRKWEEERKLAESMEIDDEHLQNEIQKKHEQREKDFSDMLARLESKYSKKDTKRKSIKNESDGSSPPKTRKATRSTKK